MLNAKYLYSNKVILHIIMSIDISVMLIFQSFESFNIT